MRILHYRVGEWGGAVVGEWGRDCGYVPYTDHSKSHILFM